MEKEIKFTPFENKESRAPQEERKLRLKAKEEEELEEIVIELSRENYRLRKEIESLRAAYSFILEARVHAARKSGSEGK